MRFTNPVLKHSSRAVPGSRASVRPEWEGDAIAAREVQDLLACPPLPKPRDLEVEVWYEPARALSGDFYDVLALDSSRVALVVGDVSGKGAPAALISASLQACLRTHLAFGGEICRALRIANRYLFQRTAPNHFATVFVGIYDSSMHTLRYVSGGHNPPLLVRDAGTIERLEATATIVGAFRGWECSSKAVHLQPNDLLLAFTDGVTESRDDHQREYGESGLLSSLHACKNAPLPKLVEAIATANRRFRHGEPQDDVTLIAVRAKHAGGPAR